MPIPLEVSYTAIGKRRRKERCVVGVICPKPMALHMGIAKPILISMGDVAVDWEQTSPGFEALNEQGIL